MGNCDPLKTNVNLDFASVDIGFLGLTISNVTLSCSQYLYNNAPVQRNVNMKNQTKHILYVHCVQLVWLIVTQIAWLAVTWFACVLICPTFYDLIFLTCCDLTDLLWPDLLDLLWLVSLTCCELICLTCCHLSDLLWSDFIDSLSLNFTDFL